MKCTYWKRDSAWNKVYCNSGNDAIADMVSGKGNIVYLCENCAVDIKKEYPFTQIRYFRKIIKYMDINIERCNINSSGIKYNALTEWGMVKSDTIKGIKSMIKELKICRK